MKFNPLFKPLIKSVPILDKKLMDATLLLTKLMVRYGIDNKIPCHDLSVQPHSTVGTTFLGS